MKLPVTLISRAWLGPPPAGAGHASPPPGVGPDARVGVAEGGPVPGDQQVAARASRSRREGHPVDGADDRLRHGANSPFPGSDSPSRPLTIRGVLPSSRRSRPAQKAGSAPVRWMTSTPSSASASASATASGSLQLAQVHGVAGVGAVEPWPDRRAQSKTVSLMPSTLVMLHRMSIREPLWTRTVSRNEAMLELRPNIGTASEFVVRGEVEAEAGGRRPVGRVVPRAAARRPSAAGGFHIRQHAGVGSRSASVEDLVTLVSSVRRAGHANRLLHWSRRGRAQRLRFVPARFRRAPPRRPPALPSAGPLDHRPPLRASLGERRRPVACGRGRPCLHRCRRRARYVRPRPG